MAYTSVGATAPTWPVVGRAGLPMSEPPTPATPTAAAMATATATEAAEAAARGSPGAVPVAVVARTAPVDEEAATGATTRRPSVRTTSRRAAGSGLAMARLYFQSRRR